MWCTPCNRKLSPLTATCQPSFPSGTTLLPMTYRGLKCTIDPRDASSHKRLRRHIRIAPPHEFLGRTTPLWQTRGWNRKCQCRFRFSQSISLAEFIAIHPWLLDLPEQHFKPSTSLEPAHRNFKAQPYLPSEFRVILTGDHFDSNNQNLSRLFTAQRPAGAIALSLSHPRISPIRPDRQKVCRVAVPMRA